MVLDVIEGALAAVEELVAEGVAGGGVVGGVGEVGEGDLGAVDGGDGVEDC